jgi:hypothetical protein
MHAESLFASRESQSVPVAGDTILQEVLEKSRRLLRDMSDPSLSIPVTSMAGGVPPPLPSEKAPSSTAADDDDDESLLEELFFGQRSSPDRPGTSKKVQFDDDDVPSIGDAIAT